MSVDLCVCASQGKFSVVLGSDGQVQYDSDDHRVERFRRSLLALVRHGLATAAVSRCDLGRAIVDVGPGSLTGVRSGVSFANGLSYGLRIPLTAINSFQIVGLDAWGRTRLPVLCAWRAGGGCAYAALYDGHDVRQARHGVLAEVVEHAGHGRAAVAVAGNLAPEVAALLDGREVVETGIVAPDARSLYRAYLEGVRHDFATPGPATPINEHSELFHG